MSGMDDWQEQANRQMRDYPQYSAVGRDLMEFRPTPELRWKLSPTPGEKPTLQQKWIATSQFHDLTYTDDHWRDVPTFEEPI